VPLRSLRAKATRAPRPRGPASRKLLRAKTARPKRAILVNPGPHPARRSAGTGRAPRPRMQPPAQPARRERTPRARLSRPILRSVRHRALPNHRTARRTMPRAVPLRNRRRASRTRTKVRHSQPPASRVISNAPPPVPISRGTRPERRPTPKNGPHSRVDRRPRAVRRHGRARIPPVREPLPKGLRRSRAAT
jgi:hypothetical protein